MTDKEQMTINVDSIDEAQVKIHGKPSRVWEDCDPSKFNIGNYTQGDGFVVIETESKEITITDE